MAIPTIYDGLSLFAIVLIFRPNAERQVLGALVTDCDSFLLSMGTKLGHTL